MSKSKLFFLFFMVFSVQHLKAQTIILSGTVKDSLQNQLVYANIIAQPAEPTKSLSFAITDDAGFYKLVLSKGTDYNISVSYLGYVADKFKLTADKDYKKNFTLKESHTNLNEVIIELPVTVKQDTIIYDTKRFVTGEERKLKNVLQKLPGVEVDKNGLVTVQGKNVTTMLVEGRKFFDGSTKLAVENIPADAIDKVQVLDNYSEVSFLKNLSDSDQMAMNILLKKDKKEFAFGDVEAGKGNIDKYRTHSNLFYYSPKWNANFIGNLNNTGEKTFTVKDYINFQGGASAILRGEGSFYNASSSDFAQFIETQDVVSSTNKFGAINLTKSLNNKVTIAGYAIFSKSVNKSLATDINQYITNTVNYVEQKETKSESQNMLGIGRFTVDYAPTPTEQWYVKTSFKQSDNLKETHISSLINALNLEVKTTIESKPINLKQQIEWHKRFTKNHTFSVAANYAYDKSNPLALWKTNQVILQGLIPIVKDSEYTLLQLKESVQNKVELIGKHYWVINTKNHLYTTLGNKRIESQLFTNDKQLLTNTTENDFSTHGFGNDVNYELNNLFVGVHYKIKSGIVELKQGAYAHHYYWKLEQSNTIDKNKWVVLPDVSAKIEFSISKKLQFNYQMRTSFSNPSKLANRYYLRSYNSVYKGNENLENELFHTARIYYSRFSLYKGLLFFGSANYTKKVKGIQNSVQFEGVNQFVTTEMITNPEERWSFNANIDKKINQLKYRLSSTMSTANYLQKTDEVLVENTSFNTTNQFSIKTSYDDFPTIEIGFKQSRGHYTSTNTKSKYVSNEPFVTADHHFKKGFIFSADYTSTHYKGNTAQSKRYDMANAVLSYQKENSPWGFKLSANNMFGVDFKHQNTFSDYIIATNKIYILPRTWMASITYKL
ncbi:MAG: carboxypeptidase-like regulatory domain-containing protein [Bacteroidetes bacterium]|nr:carboxypeptidase-like regulatory domain-containing protein [Bacteroidota bacterium]